MVKIYDQTGDLTRQELHKFAQLYDFPDYVKQADPSKPLESDPALPSTAFADPRTRQFRCDTKAGTYLSTLFFLEKKGDMAPRFADWIYERLQGFGRTWGITADQQKLATDCKRINNYELPDSAYMLVWAGENGTKERHYPLRSPGEVKAAANWFAEHRYKFAFDDRQTMANKLLEKANEHGVVLGDRLDNLLEKQAGRGTFVPERIVQHLMNRVAATGLDNELTERLTKVAGSIQGQPNIATDPTLVMSLCRTVDMFDRTHQLTGQYGSLLPPPEDFIFEIGYKEARAAVDSACQLVTGTVYNQQEFGNIKAADIRDAFGHDIADAVSLGLYVDPEKLAEVASTLPRQDAELLEQVLADNSVRPMSKSATAVKPPSREQLHQLVG